VSQEVTDEEGMMGPKAPDQGVTQRGELLPELTARQVGQDVGIGGALHQRLEHGAPRGPEDVARHRRQLDARVLEHLLQPIGLAGVLVDQRFAVSREISELPNRLWRPEAAPHEPVLQQLRDPDAVLDAL